jgi:hypothetical protein
MGVRDGKNLTPILLFVYFFSRRKMFLLNESAFGGKLKKISFGEYLSSDGISKSGLDQISRSPAHYQVWLKEKPEPTPSMVFGTAVHAALLEPDAFASRYVQAPNYDRRTKVGKEQYEEWAKENSEKIALSSEQIQKIREMQDAFWSNRTISLIAPKAISEISVFWEDSETKIKCKARADVVTQDCLILDLKTTDDASQDAFARYAWTYRYHVQAAMYLAGIGAAMERQLTDFIFVAIEKNPPYAIGLYLADKALIAAGKDAMRRDITRYAECVALGQWPAYSQEIQSLTLPRWAQN